MKKFSSLTSVLIIVAVIYWAFADMIPSVNKNKALSKTEFSIDNALHHLKNITKKQHYVGSDEHKIVRNYIVNELKKLGLSPTIQVQTAINKNWATGTTIKNIIAKIKGTEKGKSLLLLSHYDSSPHSSFGASDAGSGVVTILEGIRAFLAKNQPPKNDIVILISDAEELGLLGAKAFVDTHPWAKNVGLVLNFEARGSGGPSYMLMETNGKNHKLLSEFIKAKPNYPAASSLMYSIYKMLPNDTDLTIFREDANINGFNFAFIGDHFDYHTSQDTYERLDRNTLLHQADYFTTMLDYFAFSNLQNFNSDEDDVFVNFPIVKIISYPFSWVFPMLIGAFVLFLILLFFGISLNKITIKGLLKGFVPFFISIILCGGISFGLWKLLLIIHPQYKDILHGFTYNGYEYILGIVFLNLWILFKVYQKFKDNQKPINLIIAPIFIWLIINYFIQVYLQGAGFFIIPVFSGLLILAIAVFMNIREQSKPILFTILSIPTLYIFAPLVQMFPVGLGLKSLFISAIFIALLFGLFTPIFIRKHTHKYLTRLIGFLTVLVFGIASYNSSFSLENKKPNSLVYIQDVDSQTAYFGTYNTTLDSYTKQVLGNNPTIGSIKNASSKSKYNTPFKYHIKTDYKGVASSKIIVKKDTIINNKRYLEFRINPYRKINKIGLRTINNISFYSLKANNISIIEKGERYIVNNESFLDYYFADTDKTLTISFSVDKETPLDFILNETSFDLLTNPLFHLQPRSQEMMPTPFVTNDAIVSLKKIHL